MTHDEAFNALIALAREINPRLPENLAGQVVTVYASKDGTYAYANPPSNRAPANAATAP